MTTKIKSGVIAAGAVDANALSDNSITIAHLNCSDGTNGQVLTTDGSGTLSFSTISGYTDSDVETYLNTSEIYTDPTNNTLGIGSSSPTVALEVHKSVSDVLLELKNTSAAGYSGLHLRSHSDILVGHLGYANASAANLADEIFFGSISATPVVITTSDTERMRIDSAGDITMSGTGSLKVPSGTTAQRPSSPTAGMVRYNTTIGEFESYVVNDWKILSSRDFTYSIDYLAVAGGGGGGSCSSSNGSAAGGGAGGLLESSVTVTAGVTYTITVGSGGAGGSAPSAQRGANGVDSSISGSGISTITAIGGGGGGSSSSSGQQNGSDGGSGGGGGFASSSGGSGTAGQGNAGGFQNTGNSPYGGAGGGGAGAAAANGHGTAGGAGSSSSITGASVTYAGGGGGGNENAAAGAGGAGGGGAGGQNGAGTPGTANTGGGGGGGGGISASNGGNGGSGVVILSIPTAQYSGTTTGSPTITTSGSNTIIKFTQSGSYTA